MRVLTSIFPLIAFTLCRTQAFAQNNFYISANQDHIITLNSISRSDDQSAFGFLSIMASKNPNSSLIDWKVKNEADSTVFAIEKSTDAGKTFIPIGKIQSNGMGEYGFTDSQPVDGQNQYRLKVQDSQGGVSYSSILILVYHQQVTASKNEPSRDDEVTYLDPDTSPGLSASYYIKTANSISGL